MNNAQPYRDYVRDMLAFIDYRTTPAFDYFGRHDLSDDIYEQRLRTAVAPAKARAFRTAAGPLLVLQGLGAETCTERLDAVIREAANE